MQAQGQGFIWLLCPASPLTVLQGIAPLQRWGSNSASTGMVRDWPELTPSEQQLELRLHRPLHPSGPVRSS